MRTIIDLPESDRETLDALSRQLGISRAEAVRRAVAEFLKSTPNRVRRRAVRYLEQPQRRRPGL